MSDLTPVVTNNGGFIDKYLGDGILAIFDAEDTFAQDAINCGIALMDAVNEHNVTHRSEKRPGHREGDDDRVIIEVGIGINYGQVMLGAIGTSERIEFTVLGDAVNTASRIQELTKYFGVPMICNAEIIKRVGGLSDSRNIGTVKVRGKDELLDLYEIFSHESKTIRESRRSYCEQFEALVKSYEESGSFTDEQREAFESLRSAHPDDTVLAYYAKNLNIRQPHLYSRIEDIISGPPDGDDSEKS